MSLSGCIAFLKEGRRRARALLELGGMCLTRLLPRDGDLVLFGAWEGQQYADNPRVLFQEALERYPGKRCVWFTANPAILQDLRSRKLPVCSSGSLRAAWFRLRAAYLVLSNSFRDVGGCALLGGARVMNVWHGIPIKRIGLPPQPFWRWVRICRRKLLHYSFVATSAQVADVFQREFLLEKDMVRVLGQSRDDLFFQPHANPLRERFAGLKTLVYMPTFRGDWMNAPVMDLEKLLDLPALDAFCRENGLVFLVKFHKWTRGSIGKSYERIVVLEGDWDAQQVLDAADILITDYSGCFTDHLLLDRPQLFFAYDLDTYMQQDLGFLYPYEEIVPGPICPDQSSLMAALQDLLSGNDPYASRRHQLRDFFYSPDNQGPVARKQLNAFFLCQP